MYFIGVTTGASAIQRIFKPWCDAAGRQAELVGINLPVGAPAAAYTTALERIRNDPLTTGALVTTHKVSVIDHAAGFFSDLSEESRKLGEVSCILKRGGHLFGDTLDPFCAAKALDRIADANDRDVLILGSGGAGTALALALQSKRNCRVHATDPNSARLRKIAGLGAEPHTEDNDMAVGAMGPGAIIVNATGLGKDLPGSPVSPNVRWPDNAIAWELNYRGDLQFLRYAKQAGLQATDGWDYFVLGWSNIMSRVLDFTLTLTLEEQLQQIANAQRM